MAEDSAARGPVVLRIKLRYDDLDTMVQRFAPNVGKSGLFLPTKSLQPVGTEIKFELRLANDTPALVGVGKVKHVKPPDPKNPKAAFGMAIELMRVTREGREVIIRMIERRRALGLPDVAIPIPEDTDVARRAEVESQPRADTSGIVRDAMAQFATAPVSEKLLAPRPSGQRASGPIGVAKPMPASESLSRAVPVALPPEPSKPKRPRVAELIAQAESAPHAQVAMPELDEQVDVAKVIARARVLAAAAGGDLDAELAALRDSAATPIAVSVEAASAELARQLGGAGIAKREKSASTRWAPPPAVEISAPRKLPEPAPPAPPAPEPEAPEPEPIAVAAIPEPLPVEPEPPSTAIDPEATRVAPPLDPEAIAALAREPVAPEPAVTEPSYEPEPEPEPDEEDPELAALDDAFDAARIRTGVTKAAPPRDEPDPEMDDDDIPRLDSDVAIPILDSDPALSLDGAEEDAGERTQIGQVPIDAAALGSHALHADADADADADARLEDSLDAQLAAAEAEADADFAIPIRPVEDYDPYAPQAPPPEEIDDVDVLAEADELDADLLSADGEADHVVAPARARSPSPAAIPHGAYEMKSRRPSTYDPPSGGYTVAEDFPAGVEFDEPHGFQPRYDAVREQSALTPMQRRRESLSHVPEAETPIPGTHDVDLESALADLDVDLDEVSVRESQPTTQARPVRLPGLPDPHPPPPEPTPPPSTSSGRRIAHTISRKPKRVPTEDDGIMIDFDDDE